MLALLAVLFIVVPIVEIYVIVQVGQEIGALNTIALIVIISLVGAWLSKREGMSVLTRLRRQVEAGQVPTNELIDGFLILVGGIFLLVPGFISDVVGIFLLLPPTRIVIRKFVRARLKFLAFITVANDWNTRRRQGPPGGPSIPPDDVIDV